MRERKKRKKGEESEKRKRKKKRKRKEGGNLYTISKTFCGDCIEHRIDADRM